MNDKFSSDEKLHIWHVDSELELNYSQYDDFIEEENVVEHEVPFK